MRNFKKIKLIIGLFVLLPLISCSNSNSGTVSSSTSKSNNPVAAVNANTSPAKTSGTTDEALEKAKKEGKAVFLVITGKGVTNLNSATTIADDANKKVKKSIVVQMNRDELANSGLVVKFGVGAVSLPFILVISPKGVPVAGVPSSQASTDMLVKSVPSPRQDDVLMAISEKKPVFIVISKKTFTDKKTILANCKSASSKMATKPVIVEVDFDDAVEKAFLTQIGVSAPVNGKSTTVVVGVSGQISETFTEEPTEEKLTTAATKVVKTGGCCAGKKKCG